MRSKNISGDYTAWQLPLISDYVRKWSQVTPDNDALISVDTGETLSYRAFDQATDCYAMALMGLGIEQGDVITIQLPAVPEFFLLVYGCIKCGIIVSPVDVRLQAHEVVRDINKVNAKAFVYPGNTPKKETSKIAAHVTRACPSVEHTIAWVPPELSAKTKEEPSAFETFFGAKALESLATDTGLYGKMRAVESRLTTRDPALIIFTTGTTGDPKPALLCHENILTNNAVTARGTGLYGTNFRLLNIMPTSHVAGTSQGPMTGWFVGGAVASMGFFTPAKAMEAISDHHCTFIGGVPTHYRMLWDLPDYGTYDRSSLRFVLYGGSSVDTAFLESLSEMCPHFGTAYGMTESGGFFTATPRGISPSEMAGQVGQFFPDLTPISIRRPMNEDGTAGAILPLGEVGEICVEGRTVFLGYINNDAATKACLTPGGVLYTGDMGSLKPMGSYDAIVFSGRRKFVIKPKGYLVFPDEVADHLTKHPGVNQAQVVGAPHALYTDGVFAFVQPKTEAGITDAELHDHCKKIASYKRPSHIHFWPVGEQFPVNKVGKVDVQALEAKAGSLVEDLRKEGGWDQKKAKETA